MHPESKVEVANSAIAKNIDLFMVLLLLI